MALTTTTQSTASSGIRLKRLGKHLSFIPKLNTPLRRAVKFGAVSSATSVVCVIADGRLWEAEPGVQPFIWNFSTLLDFLILDPLVILFLGLSVRAMRALGIGLQSRGFAGLAAALGFGTMGFYYHSFGTGVFRDALVLGPGLRGVTPAGWVVFWWTSLALSYVFFAVIAQLQYLLHISGLRMASVRYEPLHVDDCAGFLRFSRPALWFFNAMLVWLLIFVGFHFQDRYVNPAFMRLQLPVTGISDQPSGFRLYAFWIFLVVAACFFIPPVLHLRRLMINARERMLLPLQRRLDMLERNLIEPDGMSAKELKDQLTAIMEIRKQVSLFPIWPLPARQLFRSAVLGPFVAALPRLTEALPKLVEIMLKGSGLQ